MTEKRFIIHGDVVSDTDMKIPITLWSDKKQQKKFCDELNALHEENQQLNKILKIIADAESFRVENSVKEILRNNLFGLDTVAGESFNAYREYTLLNNFFKEHYGEHWDNDKYD